MRTTTTKPFIHADFLLGNGAARTLYHEFARDLPVVDYHSHIDPAWIAQDRRFGNMTELWLAGDHYKWRAMRANGIAERLVSGDADDRAKFDAWAATVPSTLRNPLHHWTHMELARPFGIDDVLLDGSSAEGVWRRTAALLAEPQFGTRGILRHWNVRLVGTTDDPTDSLEHHAAFAAENAGDLRMIPTFRPDRAFGVENAAAFRDWIGRLEVVADIEIEGYDALLEALRRRAGHFALHGCRASDHGLERIAEAKPSAETAQRVLRAALSGNPVAAHEADIWRATLLDALGRMYAERNWAMQLHIGPVRNVNPRLGALLGADAGCDTIGDGSHVRGIAALLGRLDADGALPRTILYNVNPADNEAFAALAGCFQGGGIAGRVQYGAAWWFNDQRDGIERQLGALSNCGLLAQFVGMTADSRSLLSMSRHDYFRRVLCNVLGSDMEAGLLPDDFAAVGRLVRAVCHDNAHSWFGKDE